MSAQISRWFGDIDREAETFMVRDVAGDRSPVGDEYAITISDLPNAESFKVAAGFGLNPKDYRSLASRTVAIREAMRNGAPWAVKNAHVRTASAPAAAPAPAPIVRTVQAPVLPTIDGAHFMVPNVLAAAQSRLNVMLVGPAGTGKSTIGETIASHLDLPFYSLSIDPSMMRDSLFGFVSPITGETVRPLFREWFEHGGIFMADEIDNGHPSVIGGMNQALSNRCASFPDGMVERHPDAIFLASANTYGNGADSQYVGRSALDGATLDRFVRIGIPVDESMEETITMAAGADTALTARWLTHVRRVRRNVEVAGIHAIVSPRASVKGATLLSAGWTWEATEDAVLFAGMTADTRRKAEGK